MNENITIENVFAAVAVYAILLAILWVAIPIIHFILTLPMRRAEQARLFLDLVETSLKDGRPVEESLISVSHTQEQAVGLHFHLFAAWLEDGAAFTDALAKAPRLLPPKIAAMLRAGRHLGDLRKVIPACRQLLRDAVSETRGAISYIFILSLFTAPLGMFIFIKIVPKFREIFYVYGGEPSWTKFVFSAGHMLLGIQFTVLAGLALAGFLYVGGPRVARWLPVLERLHYHLPWKRKRMQRDFSTMLGILLDSGVPEPDAVRLAADSTANRVFRRRAGRVIARLAQGVSLPQAVQALDDTGEFGWRLRNAFHSRANFLRSLAAWHESLDAKAFQQQQAAAHVVTTAVVLWNGVFVGSIVTAVFLLLISIINSDVLW